MKANHASVPNLPLTAKIHVADMDNSSQESLWVYWMCFVSDSHTTCY